MLYYIQKLWGLFLSLLGFPAQRNACFRPYAMPVVVGLCLGITIHMMFAPFLEEGCELSALRKVAKRTSKIINSQTAPSTEKVNSHAGNDDFEARIVKQAPNNMTVDKEAARPKVTRPRYISTELGIKEKLFVAVLTSEHSVDKLGMAVDKTMSKHMTKVIFFSSEKPKMVPNGLPLVAFGDKRQELLPVHTLRYIKEHYKDSFDFYLFVSDRTYLRAEKYFKLVQHISVKDDVYMGVPGLDRNICALEGGALLSSSVLSQVVSHIDWCTSNLHSDNPSITFGRCVQHATQRLCSTRGGDQVLRYYPLEDFDYDADIEKLKQDPEFNQSLIFYPMPDDISHYKLHRHFCMVDLNETQHLIKAAKQDIVNLSEHGPGGRDSITWPLGVQAPHKPMNRYSVIQWTYFTDTHMFLDNELSNMKEISGADKLDIADIRKITMEHLDLKYRNQFQLKKIMNGYRRFDPTRGMEYILDLLLTDRQQQGVETIKRVHLVRPLGKVELVPMPYVTENMMVNIVLPLQPDDVVIFDVFIDTYVRTCLQNLEDVRLIVALLYPAGNTKSNYPKDPFAKPKTIINEYSKKYDTKGKLSWKALENVLTDIDIVDKLQLEFQTDVLILMTTVNMEMAPEMTSSYLNRVRMNTIKGKQVFFPMGFWQYKPNLIYNKKPPPSTVEVAQRMGLFSTKSVEHASFYLSDYQSARKRLASKSVDLYNMFLSHQSYHVFRAVEPNLRLTWMNLTCDPRMFAEKYQECVTRNMEGLASQHHLALLIYEQQHEVITQSHMYKARIVPDKNDLGAKVPLDSDPVQPPSPGMQSPNQLAGS